MQTATEVCGILPSEVSDRILQSQGLPTSTRRTDLARPPASATRDAAAHFTVHESADHPPTVRSTSPETRRGYLETTSPTTPFALPRAESSETMTRFEEAVLSGYRASAGRRANPVQPGAARPGRSAQNNLAAALRDPRRAARAARRGWSRWRPPTAQRSRSEPASRRRSTGRRTQTNLGNALLALGERESTMARLEQAVAAIPRGPGGADPRAGAARLGGNPEESWQRALRPSASARAARRGWSRRWPTYRAALEERPASGLPLQDWAMTQMNLGNALADPRRARGRRGAAGAGSGGPTARRWGK